MPRSSRHQHDVIDDHSRATDRVRKIEIMHQGRTIVNRLWEPYMGEPDAVAQSLLMIGLTDAPRALVLRYPSPGPAAMYIWQTLMNEGFGSPAVGQDWTRFLQEVGLFAPDYALPPLDMSGSYGGEPSMRIGWDEPQSMWQKVIHLGGIPAAGTWHQWDEGDFVSGIPVADYNDGGLKIVNWVDSVGAPEDYFMVHPGGLNGDFGPEGNPVIKRNNTYGFFTLDDCGGPDQPSYNGMEFPGFPVNYDSGSQPCPNAPPGMAFFGGSIIRASMWLSNLDPYLLAPPMPQAPWSGVEVPFGSIDFVPIGDDWTSNHGGIENLMETADLVMPDHGSVQAFYDRVLPRALAEAASGYHANWQFLRPGPGWYGRVEMQIREGIAVLRGSLYSWSSDNFASAQGQNILYWPIEFAPTGIWPSWHGYVLPEMALGPGSTPHLEVVLNDGEMIPLTVQNAINGVRSITVDGQWGPPYDATIPPDEIREYKLTFDGAQIPLDFP